MIVKEKTDSAKAAFSFSLLSRSVKGLGNNTANLSSSQIWSPPLVFKDGFKLILLRNHSLAKPHALTNTTFCALFLN